MGDVRNPPIPDGMGQRIRERRDELGYPRRVVADFVAEATGRRYRENWLSGIERGDTGIYLNAAIAIADFLGMSLDEMVGRRVGADIVLEDGTQIEVKQRLRAAAVEPLEAALQEPGTPEPIPLEPARRDRRRKAARSPRT